MLWKWSQYEEWTGNAILQHDSSWAHITKPVQTYLETIKWEVQSHQPYSSDILSPNNYLFRTMAHVPANQQFHSYENVSKWHDSWISSKDKQIYVDGIRNLPAWWKIVVAGNGHFLNVSFVTIFTIMWKFHKRNRENVAGRLILCEIICTGKND